MWAPTDTITVRCPITDTITVRCPMTDTSNGPISVHIRHTRGYVLCGGASEAIDKRLERSRQSTAQRARFLTLSAGCGARRASASASSGLSLAHRMNAEFLKNPPQKSKFLIAKRLPRRPPRRRTGEGCLAAPESSAAPWESAARRWEGWSDGKVGGRPPTCSSPRPATTRGFLYLWGSRRHLAMHISRGRHSREQGLDFHAVRAVSLQENSSAVSDSVNTRTSPSPRKLPVYKTSSM